MLRSGLNLITIVILSSLFLFSMSACRDSEFEEPNYIDDLITVSDNMASYGYNISNNIFMRTSMSEILRLFDESASGIVLFSSPTCPYCIQTIPVLAEIAQKYKMPIYYINTDEINYSAFDEFKSYVEDYLVKEDDEFVLYIPNVFAIVNGKCVGNYLGTVDSYSPENGNLSKYQREELRNLYLDLFSYFK